MPDDLAAYKVADGLQVAIRQETDAVVACFRGRELAERMGFSSNDQVVVVIAISELANNIVKYAGQGKIALSPATRNGRQGLVIVACDEGPGIEDVERALQDGYSTGGGLGLGLSGTQRLVDEFEIISEVGEGTMVTIRKWK